MLYEVITEDLLPQPFYAKAVDPAGSPQAAVSSERRIQQSLRGRFRYESDPRANGSPRLPDIFRGKGADLTPLPGDSKIFVFPGS